MTQSCFPREAEFEAVGKVVDAINNGTLPNTKLIYRPVITGLEDIDLIMEIFSDVQNIDIKIPQASFIGVNEELGTSVCSQIREYLDDIAKVDLLVMSATTTMLFDALHFNIPCIANFADPSVMLRQIGFTNTYVKNDETLTPATAMPVIYDNSELICKIQEVLGSPSATIHMKKEIFDYWDYENLDFADDFIKLIKAL